MALLSPMRIAAGIGGIALAAAMALVATGEWRFALRAATYPSAPITDEGWYEPLETIAGAESEPLPVATSTIVAFAEGLRAAQRYAIKQGTSALIVVHRDHVVLEHYALDHPATARTNSMSMAKTFVGLLVGAAIEDGSIGAIDDSAATHLPEWSDDPRAKITLRHLLEMRSGLENDRQVGSLFSTLTRMHLGTDMAPLLLDIPLVGVPGERYDYNNMGSQLLTLALVRATGERLATYASKKLWAPLGLGDGGAFLDDDGGFARGYCCLFATARDYARVGMMMRDGGRFRGQQIVSAEWIEQMITPSPTNPEYGLHTWVAAPRGGTRSDDRTEPFEALDMFYLDGKHKQRVFVIRSHDLVIVRLGEAPKDWDDAKLPNLLVRALRAP